MFIKVDVFFNFVYCCFEVHARRLAALKALTAASASSSEILSKLYEIVFAILEKVCTEPWSSNYIYIYHMSS